MWVIGALWYPFHFARSYFFDNYDLGHANAAAYSDPLEEAISRIASATVKLFTESADVVYLRAASELTALAAVLDDHNEADHMQQLLTEIAAIFKLDDHDTEGIGYERLQAIASGSFDERQIMSALRRAATSSSLSSLIVRIKRFTKGQGIIPSKANSSNPTVSTPPAGYSDDLIKVVYDLLRRHTCCFCEYESGEETERRRHPVRLLLKSIPSAHKSCKAQFEMLILSRSLGTEVVCAVTPRQARSVSSGSTALSSGPFGWWQDVELAPAATAAPNGHVQFEPQLPQEPTETCGDGDIDADLLAVPDEHFCKLVCQERQSRLCLRMRDGKLLRLNDAALLEKHVEHAPSMSLASVLQTHPGSLTPKMKATLAYILAQSVWQFYDSEWMASPWSSESVHYVRQYPHGACDGADLYPTKPYLSVPFQLGDRDSEYCAKPRDIGPLHRYPRVCTLGFMLLEIALGRPLFPPRHNWDDDIARINKDYLEADRLSKGRFPDEFDYETYKDAVKSCFDVQLFRDAQTKSNAIHSDLARVIGRRRDIIYSRVVAPLERVLEGVGWLNQIGNVGPLTAVVSTNPRNNADVMDTWPSRSDFQPDFREAKKWMQRIARLNTELERVARRTPGSKRVKIAVLDTGCDDASGSGFFETRRDRLVGWKDFIDAGAAWQDFDGHGTKMVSLIMRMAPQANIFVARVARNSEELRRDQATCSANVNEALRWACEECDADLISMSFGFTSEVGVVNEAIHHILGRGGIKPLLFSAACNLDTNPSDMFPASHPSVVSVRGTDVYGNFHPQLKPRSRAANVMMVGTLGWQVPVATSGEEITSLVPESGSSVATAVAAGMTAMLLDYINMKREQNVLLAQNVRDNFTSLTGLLYTLQCIAPLNNGRHEGGIIFEPWKLESCSDDVRWSILQSALR
ncbi:hypothetical protein LTR56_013034 [Elasticomyces elasticus]|nr:hypothetical protein LTR22_021973 [Elasticomyces elasticus]KAK3638562.1 hypothetical protein LTR56_013034 [Elasticomyces elasticus]KAK4928148.1 hypothetical protein LTR49_005086 [Elasticomyces elasticus]KAK5765900.1 hypothetical protein LTS12_003907 [Elasticomyces elasticus]